MTRGFASGLVWGSVVSFVGAAALSLAVPLPTPPAVGEATGAVSSPQAIPDRPATAPAADPAPQPLADVAAPGAPAPDSVATVTGATDPAAAPVIGGVTQLSQPSAPAASSVSSPSAVAPAAQPGPAPAPAPAEAEAQASIATEPSQPKAPAVAESSGFITEAPADDAPAEDTPAAEPAPEETAPRTAALPQAGSDATTGPTIGTPVTPLTDRAPGASSRLPVAGAAGPTQTAPVLQDLSAEDDLPPIRRYAASFDNPEDKPLMAIVLIDDAASVGVEALTNFPYPLTFAINPTDPEAAAKMARHRAAGFEVMALVDLDPAAAPQDAETALAATFAQLPETIGVLEGLSGGIQGNRALSDQVTEILRDGGYGLMTQANGLDTVQKLALREGVPSAVVLRDFDGAGQTPTVMRRFLDQAAFRAGQGNAVVMMGRVRPDTVSALLLWGLQDRASQVQLAPVSAVLIAGQPGE